MVPPRAAEPSASPEAAEFVRFCYRRRTVGWPELYDEMCAVASRGLFRGWGPGDLAEQGIGFGLFDLPALAALTSLVIAEERSARATERRVRVVEGRVVVPTLPTEPPTPPAGRDGETTAKAIDQRADGTPVADATPVADPPDARDGVAVVRIAALALAG